MRTRHGLFTIYSVSVCALFYLQFYPLQQNDLHSEYYSHILAIPLIAAFMLYVERDTFGLQPPSSCSPGLLFILAGLLVPAFLNLSGIHQGVTGRLALISATAIMLWLGGFVWCYGSASLRHTFSPFLFLLFMFPLPPSAMDWVINQLRWGSTVVAAGLFRMGGVPFIREGFVFNLPTLQIEVAQQCSGIRSTLALVIIGVFMSRLALARRVTRLLFYLSIVPVSIAKNGFRIALLSVLGEYGSEKILSDSWLHHSGGVLFFLLALGLLGGELWLLRRWETSRLSPHGDKPDGVEAPQRERFGLTSPEV